MLLVIGIIALRGVFEYILCRVFVNYFSQRTPSRGGNNLTRRHGARKGHGEFKFFSVVFVFSVSPCAILPQAKHNASPPKGQRRLFRLLCQVVGFQLLCILPPVIFTMAFAPVCGFSKNATLLKPPP